MSDQEIDENIDQEIEQVEEGEQTLEDVARKIGWEAGGSKSAAQYIEDTQGINRHLKGRIAVFEDKLDRLAASFTKMSADRIRQEKEKWNAELDDAIESGDKNKARKANEQLNAIQRSEQQEEKPEERFAKIFGNAAIEYAKENPWTNDPSIQEDLHAVVTETYYTNPQYYEQNPEKLYQRVGRKIRAEYPEKFVNTNRSRSSSVAGDKPPASRNQTAWDKAVSKEPEAKAAFAQLVQNGFYEDTDESRERYAKRLLKEIEK